MTAVAIPDALIKRLQGLGPHFCKVYSEQQKHPDPKQNWKKRPVGYDWQKHLMFADDPKLQEWLAEGGNYGVCGGYGLVIADADVPEVKQILEENLPETFTVESPGSHGWHAYFLCGLEKPIRLRDKDGENVGDIQGPNKMVLGPGSIHPNGGEYRIVKDLPLAQVTAQQLREALKEWIVPEKEIQRVEFAASQEKRDNVDLDILQVVPLAGLQKRGSEYLGSHPIHGSTTKQNFWVNPSKNCWHCFRHGSGGGPLLWLAVEEGIIECSEAGSGALRGEVFKEVLKKARIRGIIKEVARKEKQIGRQAKSHHIKINDLKAELIGCKVETNVHVAGEASQKAIPETVSAVCKICGYSEQIAFSNLNESDKQIFLSSVVFGKGNNLGSLAQNQKCEKGPHKFNVIPQEHMDFSILYVRDLLDPLQKFDSRVYQTRKIYLVGQRIPYVKKITIRGRVYLEPKNKDITIIAQEAEPYEDSISNFQITEEDK